MRKPSLKVREETLLQPPSQQEAAKSVSSPIRDIRRRLGLSQQELAFCVGVRAVRLHSGKPTVPVRSGQISLGWQPSMGCRSSISPDRRRRRERDGG